MPEREQCVHLYHVNSRTNLIGSFLHAHPIVMSQKKAVLLKTNSFASNSFLQNETKCSKWASLGVDKTGRGGGKRTIRRFVDVSFA